MRVPVSKKCATILGAVFALCFMGGCVQGGVDLEGPNGQTLPPPQMTTPPQNNNTRYPDNDFDGYEASVDCDDNNVLINPGATELCGDFIDNNCNNAIDENCQPNPNGNPNGGPNFGPGPNSGPGDMGTPTPDMAGNFLPNGGPGPEDMGQPPVEDMEQPAPDMPPPPPDMPPAVVDNDNDGASPPDDCNDNDPAISPGAFEVCGDNIDNNCRDGADEHCNAPMDGSDGSTCADAWDCDGLTCLDFWPGGYCSMDCSLVQCSIGSTCFELGSGADAVVACLQDCDDNSQCREDYICSVYDGIGSCVPRCTSDNDCAQGYSCDMVSGDCI